MMHTWRLIICAILLLLFLFMRYSFEDVATGELERKTRTVQNAQPRQVIEAQKNSLGTARRDRSLSTNASGIVGNKDFDAAAGQLSDEKFDEAPVLGKGANPDAEPHQGNSFVGPRNAPADGGRGAARQPAEPASESPALDGLVSTGEGESEKESPVKYIKMDHTGKRLPNDAVEWSCVLDTETNLVWETKVYEGGLHNWQDRFVWFDPGVESEVFSGLNESRAVCAFYDKASETYCTTQKLIEVTNLERLCGYSSWRLPRVEELNSIVVNRGFPVVVDSEYFPNTQQAYHWTNEPVAYDDRSAWAVSFKFDAPQNDLEKLSEAFVRLVVKRP